MPNIAGSWVRMGLWCRPSAAHSINARLAMSRPSAAQLYVSSPTIQCLGNVWQWHQTPKYYVVPDVEVTTVLPFAYIPTEPITVGESLDVTGGVMEMFATEADIDAAPPMTWFDGASADNLPFDDYTWAGTAHASDSTDLYYQRVGG
jgi:hypothetical protein